MEISRMYAFDKLVSCRMLVVFRETVPQVCMTKEGLSPMAGENCLYCFILAEKTEPMTRVQPLRAVLVGMSRKSAPPLILPGTGMFWGYYFTTTL